MMNYLKKIIIKSRIIKYFKIKDPLVIKLSKMINFQKVIMLYLVG